jgi:hypothetical protein
MGIRIQDQRSSISARQSDHMAIGQAVTTPCGYFQADSLRCRQLHIFFINQSRMGKDVNIRIQGGPVRSWGYRLDDGFSVDNDNPGAEGSGFGYESRNMAGRDMGQFYPTYHLDFMGFAQRLTNPGYPGNNEIYIRGITMIRNGDSPITFYFGPSNQFCRNKFAVAENTMGMEIDHLISPFRNRQGALANF